MTHYLEDLIWHRKEELAHIVNITSDDQKNAPMTLNEYTNIIQSQALKKQDDSERNKFKGDMLEIFAALFFEEFRNDTQIGLDEYEACNPMDDYGVDGTGINANGDKVAVQVKFRSNPKDLITYQDISKTFTSGTLHHSLNLTKPNSIYVLTNANGVTPACQEAFGNIVRVVSGNIIRGKVDNNFNFWKHFIEDMYEVLSQ